MKLMGLPFFKFHSYRRIFSKHIFGQLQIKKFYMQFRSYMRMFSKQIYIQVTMDQKILYAYYHKITHPPICKFFVWRHTLEIHKDGRYHFLLSGFSFSYYLFILKRYFQYNRNNSTKKKNHNRNKMSILKIYELHLRSLFGQNRLTSHTEVSLRHRSQ